MNKFTKFSTWIVGGFVIYKIFYAIGKKYGDWFMDVVEKR